MSSDLTEFLREWPHEPGQLNVRLIRGADGEPKVQMRLDLGVLQMEMSGRPDGLRPNGFESLLDEFEAALDDHLADETEEPFLISAEDCRRLREEAVQFYHRYISLLVLGEYDAVWRDTSRNLRVLDLCREHAEADEDREVLEQFRPYLLMMRTRAIASRAIADDEARAALFALDDGIGQLRDAFESIGRADLFEDANETKLLRGMKAELTKKLPASQKTELETRLREAIRNENYELAAILRDEINNLKDAD
ncbi:MAG: UvrB/UvrC motif-containing protein [Planctomycetota bacterium]